MSGQKVKIKTFELILGARDGGLLASCNCLTEIRFSLISSHTITIAAFVPEYLTYFCIFLIVHSLFNVFWRVEAPAQRVVGD